MVGASQLDQYFDVFVHQAFSEIVVKVRIQIIFLKNVTLKSNLAHFRGLASGQHSSEERRSGGEALPTLYPI